MDKQKIRYVKTETGKTIYAETFLLAAGSYSQYILDKIPQLRFKIPRIFFGSGSSIILKHVQHQIRHVIRSPNRAGSCGAHIVPYDDDTLYVGASNNIRLEPKNYPKARDIYYLLERAIEQFNQNLHKSEIIKWQVGNRPVTLDTYPIMGRTSVLNLWVATGTYRDGIHTSPWYAQFLAKEMLSKEIDKKNKFTPERIPLLTMNNEESIKQFIKHYICAGHEHSMKLPKIGWHELFEDIWKQRAENIYLQLATKLGLPPDLLIMLDQEPQGIAIIKEYCDRITKDIAHDINLTHISHIKEQEAKAYEKI